MNTPQSHMPPAAPKARPQVNNEEGFVLVLSLVLLLLLTLFGVWSLSTAGSETRVAVNAQRADHIFNFAEGSNFTEAGNVGYARTGDPYRGFYADIPDARRPKPCLPEKFKNSAEDDEEGTWPMAHLGDLTKGKDGVVSEADQQEGFVYRYYVHFNGAGASPQGYSADALTAYRFRVQANKLPQKNEPPQNRVIETGGVKLGLKLGL